MQGSGGGSRHELTDPPRQAKHVQRPQGARLDGLDRVVLARRVAVGWRERAFPSQNGNIS